MDGKELRQKITEVLPRIRRFAYSLTGTKADADDLLQATVLRLLERSVPGNVDLAKWAFRVCKNIWVDELRARNVRTRAATSGNIVDRESYDGQKSVMDKLVLSEINDALNQLPDEQRAVLVLVTVEGYSYADAADVLDTPVGTVMSRISRARATLNKLLNPESSAVVGSTIPSEKKT